MFRLGLRINDRCTMECKHCMYSCSPRHGEKMSGKVIRESLHFFERHIDQIYNFGIWGGEPFMDLQLFDVVFQNFKPYLDKIGLYVSTNGFWVNSQKHLDYIDYMLQWYDSIMPYEEMYGIYISNSKWHQENRTTEIQNLIESYRGRKYFGIKDIKNNSNFNPTGRALNYPETCDMTKRAHCMFCDTEWHSEIEDIEISPNGDIQVCCGSESAILGNILEDKDITIDELTIRAIKAKRLLWERTCSTEMIEICKYCSKIKRDDVL